MRVSLLITLLASIVFAGTATALDPELKVPYRIRVVVRVGDHPAFTAHFRAELLRDLQGSLQAALGTLGAVEMIDLNTLPPEKWEPLWKQVDDKGLTALDGFNEVGPQKTHFLRIDHVGGHYELQARQHDGTSGFVTPIVRKTETHHRGFIGRIAGLMIGRDFGLVGTFDTIAGGNTATLRFKGGELSTLDKWVKKGDVFAVVQLRNAPRRPAPKVDPKQPKDAKEPKEKLPVAPSAPVASHAGYRVEGVLMQVVSEPQKGICQVKMFHRYEEALPMRGVIGYRCVKLGTVEAPLKLQLVDNNGAPHRVGGLNVSARNDDFPTLDKSEERDRTVQKEGVFVSKEPFNNVAFVRVQLGTRNVARIPIEILDDRVEIRGIKLEAGAELKDRVEQTRRDLMTRITDGRLVQIRCFQDITALEQGGKNQQAFDRGQAALKSLEAISAELQDDITRVQERITKELSGGNVSLADCEQQLQVLRAKQQELKDHLDALQVAIREENDPNIQAKRKKVQDLVRRAELLITQAEYDQALTVYDQALVEVGDEPVAKLKIEQASASLRKAWALRENDPAHAESRKWIYTVWPKITKFQDLRDLIGAARQAFEKCKAVGDRLTVNKMQLAGTEIVSKLLEEFNQFDMMAREEEEKRTLEAMTRTKNDLEKLLADVDAYLKASAPK